MPTGVYAQGITVYVGSEIDTLDPHHTTTFAGHVVANALHQGLLQYQSDGQLGPALAVDWTVSDNGLNYRFTMKAGMKWSDGAPLSANDVVAGMRRSLDPARPSPFASRLYPIKNAEAYVAGELDEGEVLGISAIDAETVEISLNRRDADFLHILAHPIAKPAPDDNPDLIDDGSVTSGAYSFESEENGRTTLVAESGLPTLTFQSIASVQGGWQASLSQDAFITAALPIVTVPRVGDRGDVVRSDGGESLYAYAVNMERRALDTLEVRHALAMSIDRPGLIKKLPITSAVPATQFVPPTAKTYEKSYVAPFTPLTFEEREAVAEALLAEQGIEAETDFVVRLRIPAGDIHNDVALSVAKMWAAVGIKTEIIQAPFPSHWQAVAAGDFDIAFVSWPSRRDSPRDALDPLSRAAGPWNFARYRFPAFDERLARAAESAKEELRADYYREAEKALIEDQSLIALFFYQPLVLVSSNVAGWQSNASGIHPLTSLSLSGENQKPRLTLPSLPKAVPTYRNEP